MLVIAATILIFSEFILSISGLLDCCKSASLTCLKSHHGEAEITKSAIASLNKTITMFTYETDHIVDYALHSFAVNSEYAQYRNYDLVLTTSKQGFEFESRDQRWNKVKIMETFITELSKGFRTDDKEDRYLVWLDSDLIFLNFELDLSALVAQYPLADLMLSADVEPLNGMVNTGCMIVRVSSWSQLFFQEWWEATDRVNGMDQHVFDLLYRRRKNTEEVNTSNGLAHNDRIDEKIAILPTYALNSHIPASRHQESHHNILHLAGESSVVRAHVFQKAHQEVCRAHALSVQKDGIALNTAYLAVQLGLSREVLQAIDYPAVLYSAVRNIWQEMLQCGNIPTPSMDARLEVDGDTSSAMENSNQHCEVEHVLKVIIFPLHVSYGLRAMTKLNISYHFLFDSCKLACGMRCNRETWPCFLQHNLPLHLFCRCGHCTAKPCSGTCRPTLTSAQTICTPHV